MMCSWYPSDDERRQTRAQIPPRAFLYGLPMAALLWLLLVLAVYGAIRFGAWNGAR